MSTIYLVKDEALNRSKNSMIDDIYTFIDSYASISYQIQNFQYQKITLTKQIKVELEQSEQITDYNYCCILQDNKKYYYYIISSKWISSNCIMFDMYLDTLNTFGINSLTSKTQKIREHKKRFKNISKLTGTKTFDFLFDKVEENLGTLPSYKTKDEKIEDSASHRRGNWYLVYRTINDEQNSKLVCELYPKNDVSGVPTGTRIDTPSTMIKNKMFFVTIADSVNSGVNIITAGGSGAQNITLGASHSQAEYTSSIYYGIEYTNDGTRLKYRWIYRNVASNGTINITYEEIERIATQITFNASSGLKVRRSTTNSYDYDTKHFEDYVELASVTGSIGNLTKYANIDKTDTRIVKIIECPYCPIQLSKSNAGYIVVPNGWNLINGTLILNDLDFEFENMFKSVAIDNTKITISAPNNINNMAKSKDREPKLFTSQFRNLKLNYDSYNAEIKREMLEGNGDGENIELFYKQSNGISSDLAFRFEGKNNDTTRKSIGDYDNYLLSSRNNEKPVFTSNYLEYIRTGINFDRKQNEISRGSQIASSAISIGAGAISGLAVSGGNPVGAIVGAVGGILSSLTSAIVQQASFENSINSKLEQMKRQSMNVSVSNDLNLLNYYNGNKAHLIEYTLSEELENKIFDLLFYCGYASNGQGIPATKSRYWFNFVQCDAVFNDTIPEEFKEDMHNRLLDGVTIYHHNNAYEYDFGQERENWEVEFE